MRIDAYTIESDSRPQRLAEANCVVIITNQRRGAMNMCLIGHNYSGTAAPRYGAAATQLGAFVSLIS